MSSILQTPTPDAARRIQRIQVITIIWMSVEAAFVVDDYEPFRRFVCSMLEQSSDFQIVGEASDGLEALQKAEELNPDLIFLDIGLPELNGIEACHRMSSVVPAAKIIFVTQNNDAETVRAALSNGASGYVLKLDANNELLPAVEAVLQGGPIYQYECKARRWNRSFGLT
jgi:DNA-binding NarL/FixJ family response regulator